MSDNSSNSDEEFYDCTEPFPSKFYAIAVPRASPGAGLFSSISQAQDRLKKIKGSRLKAFYSIQDASDYSVCPVVNDSESNLPILEVEVAKFPSVKQIQLTRFRRYVESNDVESISACIVANPMYLLTGNDTPTILQLVFRFNAIHVAARSGHVDVIKLILSHLESPEFWDRVYPSADTYTAEDRRRRVLDLYLNSPELGGLSSPLHLASRFGHVECVRVLASHPATLLDLRDYSNCTPLECVCVRLVCVSSPEDRSQKHRAICRALDERYVVLVDRYLASANLENKPTILPQPILARQLHHLLSSTDQLMCRGMADFCPLLTHLVKLDSQPPLLGKHDILPFSPRKDPVVGVRSALGLLGSTRRDAPSHQGQMDLQNFGATGTLVGVRAVLGPLSTDEARQAIDRWRKPPRPFWLSLRLMDAEKGYERYGRRLADEFNTKWVEYWEFLNDFADLRSQYGLRLLNDYLSQFYSTDATGETCSSFNRSIGDAPRLKIVFEEQNLEQHQHSPKLTPIKRVRQQTDQQTVSRTTNTKIWTAYRDINNPNKVLSDSAEGSSSSTTSANSSLSNGDRSPPSEAPAMSPVIGMLNNFIVSSPFRFILPNPCGGSSPILLRPERRISLFSKVDVMSTPDHRQEGSKAVFSSTLPSSVRKTLPRSISRRRVIDGIWPSLIDASNKTTSLQAAITTAELSAYNAVDGRSCSPSDAAAAGKTEADLEDFPFVKRWKKELDSSMQP